MKDQPIGFKIITAKHLQTLFETNERNARKRLARYRKKLNREVGQPVFFGELCTIVNKPQEELRRLFKW